MMTARRTGHAVKSMVIAAVAISLTLVGLAQAEDSGAPNAPPSAPAAPQPTTRPESPTTRPTTDPAREAAPKDDPGAAFAAAVEKAHGADAWRIQFAVQCELKLALPKGRKLEGKLTYDIDDERARISQPDGGPVMVFDGERAWFSPPTNNRSSARFSLKTWPYFLAAPFKLRDPGAHLQPLGTKTLRDRTFNVAKLTFDPGVGDTPDDWYELYSDPETGRLEAMAYIVTFGQSLSDAEKVPHAITYEDFVTVEGVTLASTWKLWEWSKETGLGPAPIGQGTIANIRFGIAGDELFERPGDSAEDQAPARVTESISR